MTQIEMIKDHIERYGSITPIEALREYGIMRLASRISDLKRQGVEIKVDSVKSKNRFGKTVQFARYHF